MSNRTATFKTSQGDFTLELFEDKAPKTTANFIKIADGMECIEKIGKVQVGAGDCPVEDIAVSEVIIA